MARTNYRRELGQDIGYALRMLRRTPGFTAVAVLTLALGIGATSAIFSVVHGVVFAALPYQAADHLYHVRTLYPDGTAYLALSAPDFASVRQDSRAFDRVEAYALGRLTLLGVGEPQEVRGATVSGGLFDLLGVPVAIGRGFLPEENQPGHTGVAVLDHGFWQRAFGADAAVLGRAISMAGRPYTIVGVLAAGARLPEPADVYAPLEYDDTFNASTATARRSEFLGVLARARPGADAAQVDDDLKRIGTALQHAFPDSNERLTFNAIPLRDLLLGDVRTPLLVLLGAVGFVLLVACVNVANLLLARASAREGELAVRAALGAGRPRLVRQLLTESLVLGLAGGVLGLVVASGATRALVAAQPADIPRLDEVGVNGIVVLFTAAIALVTSLAFGTLPAMQATTARLTRALHEGGRGGIGGGHRMRAALVVAEMTLAVVLLTGAGLLIRSFVEMTRLSPGFQPGHAMAFRVSLSGDAYETPAVRRARVAALEAGVRALPGVTDVAASSTLPLSGLGSLQDFMVVGAPPPPPNVNREIAVASATPGYFRAIGARLVRGRDLAASDHGEAPPVALINEAAVRRWFPDRDPIGQHVSLSGVAREVVGIVADVRQRPPGREVAPQLVMPYAQRPTRDVRFVMRSAGDPLAMAGAIRAAVRGVDGDLAVADMLSLDQLVARSVAGPRFYTMVMTLFAGVALALAGVGIFGVMSYTVAQRTREIGVRMALGARASDVLRLIVGRALLLAGTGALLGLVAATALARVMRSQLFGVNALDPLTLAGAVAVLLASAAAASLLPARRAACVDPGRALREG